MSEFRKPVALTIAGSDPSGGAGIQADLKTFHQFGVYGEAAITLLTVQNTRGVYRVHTLPPDLVLEQVRQVLADIPPAAAKTGALGDAAIVEAVAALAGEMNCPLVVDPVMISKHGAPLMDERARGVFLSALLPRVFLLTPNLHEAAALAGFPVQTVEEMRGAAQRLVQSGAQAVLVKGGHREHDALDLLYWRGEFFEYAGARCETRHTHGTGCTYSAAITALLATSADLPEAVAGAKRYIQRAIETNPGLGSGSGPVNHHAPVS
jgi:hydroxymethylpyrimidine/phosphomethylpyrimidine kinase